MRKIPEFVLTLGVDASGKSSFNDRLSTALGYVVLEPTRTEEALAFKESHRNDPLDLELVHSRRDLFRRLNNSFDTTVREELRDHRVITTGHRLVTEISHAVMSKIVGNEDYSIEQIIEEWKSNNPLVPDEIIFTHAPMSVIQDRILARIAAGHALERMTGFNSLYFLGHYQDALGTATELLGQYIPVFSGDTSVISVESGLEQFIN